MSYPRHLSRRTALRGLGVCVALPFLEAMRPCVLGSATGDLKSPPLRMAFLYVPNGVHMPDWTPAALGAGFELPPILEPLRAGQGRPPCPERPDLGPGPGPRRRRRRPRPRHGQLPDRPPAAEDRRRRHPRRRLGRSAGRPEDRPGDPLSLAGDRLRGRQERRQLRSRLQLCLSVEPFLAERIDARAKEINPRLVFDRLFGSPAGNQGGDDPARSDRHNKSILDFVGEDAEQLQSTLGTADRRKLDEYLTGVREIEQRIGRGRGEVDLGVGRSIHARWASRPTTRSTCG